MIICKTHHPRSVLFIRFIDECYTAIFYIHVHTYLFFDLPFFEFSLERNLELMKGFRRYDWNKRSIIVQMCSSETFLSTVHCSKRSTALTHSNWACILLIEEIFQLLYYPYEDQHPKRAGVHTVPKKCAPDGRLCARALNAPLISNTVYTYI